MGWGTYVVHLLAHARRTYHPPTHPPQDYGIILNGLASLGAQPEETAPGFLNQLRDLALPLLPRFNDQCVG